MPPGIRLVGTHAGEVLDQESHFSLHLHRHVIGKFTAGVVVRGEEGLCEREMLAVTQPLPHLRAGCKAFHRRMACTLVVAARLASAGSSRRVHRTRSLHHATHKLVSN